MDLTPVVVLNSFLEQASKLKMAVVVFAGFLENGNARFLSKHTLKEGTEKAFLGMFLATDDHAVEAAAKALCDSLYNKFNVYDWSKCAEEDKEPFRKAARAAIEAARNPERAKILGPGGTIPS